MNLHADARAVLARWDPPDGTQERLRRQFLHHLLAHPDGMLRDSRDHVTASALVLEPVSARVLLILHRKAQRWLQPGGHCEEADATLSAAALREVTEETGIAGLRIDPAPVQLSRHEVPFCGPVQPAYHLDVQYLVTSPRDAVAVISDESDGLAWFDVEALPMDTDETVRTLVSRAVALQPGGTR